MSAIREVITTFGVFKGIEISDILQPRARSDEMGGIYYGGQYFNNAEVDGKMPPYTLLKHGAIRVLFHEGNNPAYAYVIKREILNRIKKIEVQHFIDWAYYRSVPMNALFDFVFPSNFLMKLDGRKIIPEEV